MWPVLADINGVKITIFGLAMAAAFLLASFLTWRSMRLDYGEEDILSLTIVLAIISLLAFLGWRWWSIGGVLFLPALGLWLWSRKMTWNIWEWLDTLGPISLILGVVACLAWGPSTGLPAVYLMLGVIVGLVLKKIYRQLHWYKNGKAGFVGVVSIAWWMATWVLIANWHNSKVYWAGLSLESWVGLWVIIAGVITLYVRGGRRVTQDWRHITKLWQAKKPQ